MIKFLGHKDGKPLYGFGLTRGNCEKLLEQKPIVIDLDVMCARAEPDASGMRGCVLIFGGESEADMARELLPKLSPDTIVIGEPEGS